MKDDSNLQSLAARARVETDTDELLNLGRKLKKFPRDAFREAGYVEKRIAVLSGYTSQLIVDLLRAALFRSGIAADIYEAPYGTYESAVYGEDPELVAAKPEVIYFCVGSEHLDPRGSLDAEISRWRRLVTETRKKFACEIVLNTFEEPIARVHGTFESKLPTSRLNHVRALNRALVESAESFLHFFDVNHLASVHGRLHWRDEKLYDLSKIPVSFQHLPDYAEGLAAVIGALYGRTKKCLVLDLDNTLWGGVVGDDGYLGIEIGEGNALAEAHLRLQKYVKALQSRGVILAVCSKNDERIAKEAFTKRPEMPLKLEDFSAFFANWEPKSENIVKIAKKLNIGLDSLVFVDDNPAEREIIRRNVPAVTVPELPEDASAYERVLATAPYFDIVNLTKEDQARTEQYRANQQREKAMSEAEGGNYEDYLRSLEMKAVIAPFDPDNLPRIAQLINKTNQFNVTTRRYAESEVAALSADSTTVTRYVKLKDRFGDNGLISVFIGKIGADGVCEIDTWLMSCRVLKRQVENALFADVVAELAGKGVQIVRGTYLPTEKNGLVANLFADLGFAPASDRPGLPAGATSWVYEIGKSPLPSATIRKATEKDY